MSSLSFPDVCKAATDVFASKKTTSVLYLDKTGMPTSDSAKQASIIEIFHCAKKLHAYSESDEPNWRRYVITIGAIIGKEYPSAQAALLFNRLILGLDLKIMKAEELPDEIKSDKRVMHSLFTLCNTSRWISEQCIQEMFITLKHEYFLIVEDFKKEFAKIPDSLLPFFKKVATLDDQEKAIKTLIDAVPRSVFGGILFEKLKSDGDEPSVSVPFSLRPEGARLHCSLAKISSFAERGFIDELIGLYPELSEGLEEIYKFCNLIKNLNYVLFAYKKMKAALEVLKSFELNYLEVIKLHQMVEDVSYLSYKQSYTKKLLELKKTDAEVSTKPSFDDLFHGKDFDVKSFLEITSDYFSSYRPFFYKMFDELKKIHTEEIAILLGLVCKAPKATVSYYIKDYTARLSAFDARFSNIRRCFMGPHFSEIIPLSSEWAKYISEIKAWMHNAFKNEDVIESDYDAYAITEAIKTLKKGPSFKTAIKHVDKLAGPAARGGGVAKPSGGGGASPSPSGGCGASASPSGVCGASASTEALKPDIAKQIKTTRRLFSKPKTSKVVDLYEEIGKEKLEFSYAERVLNWLYAPDDVLKVAPYHTMPKDVQEKMVKIHAFSLKVDHFLNSRYCQKRVWRNSTKSRDEDLYVIPGFMTFGGVTHKGVFEYCITDQCYHRCFKILRSSERFSDYLDAPDFDYAKAFPSLHETASAEKPVVATCSGDFEVTIDPLGAAHFADGDVTYTLLNLT